MNRTAIVTLEAFAYLALVMFASPLVEGVMRKVKAIVHSRQGPPIVQPYLDLAKLLVKEDVVSDPGVVARFAPLRRARLPAADKLRQYAAARVDYARELADLRILDPWSFHEVRPAVAGQLEAG